VTRANTFAVVKVDWAPAVIVGHAPATWKLASQFSTHIAIILDMETTVKVLFDAPKNGTIG